MALRELLATFDVTIKGDGALKKTLGSLDQAAGKARGFAGALDVVKGAAAGFVAALGASKISDWIFSATAAVDEYGKLATTLNFSTDSIQAWEAFAKTSGGTMQDVSATMRRLSKNVIEASQNINGPAAQAFRALGVETADARGEIKNLDDILIETAGAIAKQENTTKKLAYSNDTLGRASLKLIPGFVAGTEAMRAQIERMKELAGVYSEEFIRTSEKVNDELFFMKKQLAIVRSEVILATLPTVRALIDWFIRGASATTKFIRELGGFRRVLQAPALMAAAAAIAALVKHFGSLHAIAGRLWGLLLRFGKIFAPWIAWSLVLDDILVFLQGGDSLLGRWLDKIFGVGSAKKVLESIRDVIKSITDAGMRALEAISDMLSAIFGADFSPLETLIFLLSGAAYGFVTLKAATVAWAALKTIVAVASAAMSSAIGGVELVAAGLNATLGATGVALAAVAAAVAGIWAAVEAAKELASVTEGLGVTGLIGEMIERGTFDPFAAVDAYQNEQAIARTKRNLGSAEYAARFAPQAPGSAGNQTVNVGDVNVSIGGKATPETVQKAHDAATRLQGRQRANAQALIKGKP